MKKICMLICLLLAFSYSAEASTQVDSLIEKLMEKGILTKEEGDMLKERASSEAKTTQESNAKESNTKTNIPEWVTNTKVNGDLRVRNQMEHRRTEDVSETSRDRIRMRARLGMETKVNDQFKVALGVATNGGTGTGGDSVNTNPRGNNITLDHSFSKGTVVLNYAYGQYAPNEQWLLTAGQMKNPIWEPMEFLWDSDITPTGGAVQYNYKLNDSLNLFTLGSMFVIKELGVSNADPFMYVSQVGLKGKILDTNADYKVSGMYQGVQHNTKTLFDNRSSPATNTTNGSNYKYHYNTPVGAIDLGINNPFSNHIPLTVARIGVFGEYAINPHPSDERTAWMTGAYMGNPTVAKKGEWKLTGAYKSLGRDAWLDILPDSDFYGGATDVKGYEAILEYGLAKNVSLSFDYYRTQRRSSLAAKSQETLFQTDLNLKF